MALGFTYLGVGYYVSRHGLPRDSSYLRIHLPRFTLSCWTRGYAWRLHLLDSRSHAVCPMEKATRRGLLLELKPYSWAGRWIDTWARTYRRHLFLRAGNDVGSCEGLSFPIAVEHCPWNRGMDLSTPGNGRIFVGRLTLWARGQGHIRGLVYQGRRTLHLTSSSHSPCWPSYFRIESN